MASFEAIYMEENLCDITLYEFIDRNLKILKQNC